MPTSKDPRIEGPNIKGPQYRKAPVSKGTRIKGQYGSLTIWSILT
jgi:hypothetical protein